EYDLFVEETDALASLLGQVGDLAFELLDKLMRDDVSRWERTSDRQQLFSTLSILSLGRHTIGDAGLWADYLDNCPEDTRAVARYFAHLARAGDPMLAIETSETALSEEHTDWQRAW